MDAFVGWLGQDWHWAWLVLVHVFLMAVTLDYIVHDGMVATTRWERVGMVMAIVFCEAPIAFLLMMLGLDRLGVVGDWSVRYSRRVKRAFGYE